MPYYDGNGIYQYGDRPSRPKFQRRQYEVIAEIIRTAYEKCTSQAEYNEVTALYSSFVTQLRADNSAFDSYRFADASGYYSASLRQRSVKRIREARALTVRTRVIDWDGSVWRETYANANS